MNDEYVSNPKLQVLARELELLNAALIKQGFDGYTRLQRLRAFAQNTLASSWRVETFGPPATYGDSLPGTRLNRRSNRWIASITIDGKPKYIGTFDTPDEAHAAYRARHIEQHGIKSQFHPDAEPSSEELIAYAQTLGITPEAVE